MKIALVITALLFALLLIPTLFRTAPGPGEKLDADALPWAVEPLGDGRTRIFGLVLGNDVLQTLQQRLGNDNELALIAAPGEVGSVELYFERLPDSFPAGRIIATADLSPEIIAGLKARAGKSTYMDSSTRRYALSGADRELVMGSKIRALSYIPAVNLDEATILQRFGPPAERIKGEGTTEHFLYPDKGLDLVLDTKGRELLQYVPPSRFAALREPLVAKPQAAAAGK